MTFEKWKNIVKMSLVELYFVGSGHVVKRYGIFGIRTYK